VLIWDYDRVNALILSTSDGNLPLRMAIYHYGWQSTTTDGNLPLRMAIYHNLPRKE